MSANQLNKSQRQKSLLKNLEKNPFYTDEELSRLFSVSIQTIRLDRLELGIPELRERLRNVAEKNYSKVKSLSGQEIVGELADYEPEKEGLSILDITEEMVFARTRIARGHHLFAQANSLAIALVDAEQALTGSANVTFVKAVHQGERIIARGKVKSKSKNKYIVSVVSKCNNETVFKGKFVVFAVNNKEVIN